jgi:hypothetical protein
MQLICQAASAMRHEIREFSRDSTAFCTQFEMQTHKHVRARRFFIAASTEYCAAILFIHENSRRNNMLLMNENEKCLCNDADAAPDFDVQFKHMHEFRFHVITSSNIREKKSAHRNVNWRGGDAFICRS